MERPGILLIHGFGGGPHEVAPLEKSLAEQHYRTVSVTLKGHGEGRSALSAVTRADWIASAERKLLELQECGPVAVVGFSMGGLIAMHLYQSHPFDALVLINTPVWYWNLPQVVRNLRDQPGDSLRFYLRECSNKPFRALLEFTRLLTESRALPQKVSCQTLVCQTRDDDTVQPRSADFLASRLAGRATVRYYDKGGHNVFYSDSREEIAMETIRYVNELWGDHP